VHSKRPQRAHDALEDPTPLPQRQHSALSNTWCKRQAAAFVLSMLKTHSFSRVSRRSAAFWTLWKRCEDAALVWQGFYFMGRWRGENQAIGALLKHSQQNNIARRYIARQEQASCALWEHG